MRAYPAYKDSGLPWAVKIPAHWTISRGKWLFQQMDRPVRPEDEVVTAFRDGTVTLRKNRREDGFTNSLLEIGYQGIRKGDLVIHAMDAFAGAIGVSDSDGKSTPVYAACVPKKDENPVYFCQLLRHMSRTGFIEALARGIRERSSEFRFEQFANLEYFVPPQVEQDAIVAFLEAKGAEIQKFIDNQRRKIELLKEQKSAFIDKCVTRGVHSTVELKRTGVSHYPIVPSQWGLFRVRHLVKSIDQGISPMTDGGLADENHWGVLKAGCVNGGVFNQEEHKRLPSDFPIDHRIAVHAGDVLVSRASGSPKLVGSVGCVGALQYRLILSLRLRQWGEAL